ncbi:hypothetical protein MJO29_001295 [Puccinia striiformis f. sp. tritici]|uniref:Uncharacterized protein n=1 Tax=Puccinia striiformis f. sp. tritici PST-78 TaxID=1165861 RepID=A0A0L0VDU6_9BASI|nr:hypothetical protein Pst134EB_004517 [Puccinia striiformis f. sp. tritici]KAI9620320.1 hypothetical protein KEM48_008212 [Puccinia striiformis f. sp. tritici PST-130]KNE97375.1 hypothetical protein PSTG_09351 [Puccinia striiformis f. sp. tritici PST-78]KAI7965547.1 hypothetical protein MJO29_001295 [Puccinia striiformis f. sp. tritici]KNE97376.1 hypothetical protein, variant 1 [Puccinia striiformis f. sp. tritici PST-78]
MASSKIDFNTRIAPVLEALRALHHKYHTRSMERDPDVGKEQGVLTQDEVHLKRDLFESLRSSLLPSIKPHLSALLTALDLPRDAIQYPNPDIESILDILANLDQTVENAVQYINTAPLKPFGRKDPHDHHLGQCKTFRCFNLKTGISCLAIDIRWLFWTYIKLIESWNLPWDPTEDTRYRSPTPRGQTLECLQSIDRAIRRSRASDFAYLQEEWRDVSESFNYALVKLANLTNSQKKNNSVTRRHVVEHARLALPVNKLLRTLFIKISNTATKKLLFTLDAELNSTTLYKLDVDPGVIVNSCKVYAKQLEDSHRADSMTHTSGSLRSWDDRLVKAVESTVFLLALYIIPLSSKIDHSSLESDFKAWLSEWQGLWHTAHDRLLHAMHISEAEGLY